MALGRIELVALAAPFAVLLGVGLAHESDPNVCVRIELRSSPMIALRTCQQQSSTASVLGWNMFGGELLRFDSLPKERLESVPCYAERTDVQRADVMRKLVAHDDRTRRGERLRAVVEPRLPSFQ